ncbi:MAG: tryptophan 2,3-dioxygenase family protein [Myxococcales bacterium]|nr:tryptophan 2,3-dioxygenase family protein [Myxococcota bacterium]MDW8282994.1 tryptophan 2,3-dioxygenase family protein [Myxococcales bacterium]
MAASPLTDYEIYIRTAELLALQKRPEALACHDELQFQIVHQTAELWMKLIDHEMRYLCRALDEDRLTQACRTLGRVHRVQQLLLDGLELLYTMSPLDYMRIREVLGRGSGQESPGFRRLLALGGEVWPHFEAVLARRGLTLEAVYRRASEHPEVHAVAEGLLDFDLRLQEWRNRHLLLVYRTIGVGTPSLKGKHSELLERGLRTQFFPRLWAVRDELFDQWSRTHPGGATRYLSERTGEEGP